MFYYFLEQHFEETLADHLKALKLCDRLLDNLGSIYHRVRPLKKGQTILARALTDFESKQVILCIFFY